MNWLVDNLAKIWHSLSSSEEEETPAKSVADYSLYDGTRLRRIRVGCVLRKRMPNDTYKYFLGRRESLGTALPSEKKVLTTSGGWLDLSSGFETPFEGLIRESVEDGLVGRYKLKPETITPRGVIFDSQNGVMQYYSAELEEYPMVGITKEAVFRPRSDHRVVVRWCTIDQIVDGEVNVPEETRKTIGSTLFFKKSGKLRFNKQDMQGHVWKDGDLLVPVDVRNTILRSGRLPWGMQESLGRCSVFYDIPRYRDIVDGIHVFFLTGPFLYQANVDAGKVQELQESLHPKGRKDFDWEGVAKEYVRQNYDEIIRKDLLSQYIV